MSEKSNINLPVQQQSINGIKKISQKMVQIYDSAIASYTTISNPLSAIKTPDDFGDRLSKFVFGGPFQLSYNSTILINLSDLPVNEREKFNKALSDYKLKCANSHTYDFNIIENGKGEYLLPYHAVLGLANECAKDKNKIADNCRILQTLGNSVIKKTQNNKKKANIYKWTTLAITLFSGSFTILGATGLLQIPAAVLYISIAITVMSLCVSAGTTIVRVVRTMMEEKDASQVDELIDKAKQVKKELQNNKINCVTPIIIAGNQPQKQPQKQNDKKKPEEKKEEQHESNSYKKPMKTNPYSPTKKPENADKKYSNDLQDTFNKKTPKPLNNNDNLLGTTQINKQNNKDKLGIGEL